MPNQLDVVRTCALLHDIGKLECWANRKPWSEHTYCTYKFVRECLGEDLAVHAMRHHAGVYYSEEYRPKTLVEDIICLADNLASGADRREIPESGSFVPSPPVELAHVLNLNVVRSSMDSARLAYVSQVLLKKIGSIKEAFYEDSSETYRLVFNVLKGSDLRFVPADTRRPINDVSLWNHLKLTAAFATCIFLEGYNGSDPARYRFALLSGDADRISSFINESLRLPDLNARSQRIDLATEDAAEAISRLLGPECLLYAAGGGFLALSPPEMAEKVLDEAKRTFEEKTRHRVTLTVSYVVEDGETFKEAYGKVWEKSQRAMRLKKSQRYFLPKAKVEESLEVCDVCRKAKAVKADEQKVLPIDASPRPEKLCESCWNLRKEGRGVWLNDLKRDTNFVACIRADGDNIGTALAGEAFKRQNKASTPSRLSTLSDLLQNICDTFKGLVADFNGRSLFAGGDDVLAFVPGEKGLEVARIMASKFKKMMADECTMSAGVAVFHYKLPVYVGLESAGHLLSKAKEDGKNRVAFAIIGGSGVTRSELETVKSRTWKELDTILRIVDSIQRSEVASTQLRRIAEVAADNVERAEVLIKHLMGREIIDWIKGERLLSYLESGLLVEAFLIYNLFRRG